MSNPPSLTPPFFLSTREGGGADSGGTRWTYGGWGLAWPVGGWLTRRGGFILDPSLPPSPSHYRAQTMGAGGRKRDIGGTDRRPRLRKQVQPSTGENALLSKARRWYGSPRGFSSQSHRRFLKKRPPSRFYLSAFVRSPLLSFLVGMIWRTAYSRAEEER